MAKNGKKWLKMAKKMAKIGGKILGSNIYLCKKIDILQLHFDIGKAQKSENASGYILAKNENEF